MRERTAVVIRHVAFEDLGAFRAPLEAAGFGVEYLDVGLHDLARLDALAPSLLVVLGGPISVYEETRYPFLVDEIALLERRLAADRPTLGICLGAQLMARALGANVAPGAHKEIGFGPLALTDAGRESCLAALDGHPVLHWHGDRFEIPAGATRLASTPLCDNQAFSRGPNALALQFHPEAGVDGFFERWLIGHTIELANAGVDVPKLRAEHDALAAGLRQRGEACITRWLEGLAL